MVGNITTQISSGAVYKEQVLLLQVEEDYHSDYLATLLQLDDNLDRDFNDLTITPDRGDLQATQDGQRTGDCINKHIK